MFRETIKPSSPSAAGLVLLLKFVSSYGTLASGKFEVCQNVFVNGFKQRRKIDDTLAVEK